MKRIISVVLCFVLIALSANGLFVSADSQISTTVQTESQIPIGEIYLEEPTTEEPTTEEPTTEESTTAEPTTEESTTAEPTTEEPTTEESTTEESTTEESTTGESTTDEPTTEELTTGESTTQELATDETTTQEITSSATTAIDSEFAGNLEDITIPAQNNGDVSTLATSEFWITNTSGQKVVQQVLTPGQSWTFEIHENYFLYSASNVTWSATPSRGTLSTTTGDTCVFTAGSACGTTTLTATLASGISYSIKIYIVRALEIIRPTTYNKVTYEHIYVGASKEVRGNTVDNTEYNSDLLAYWSTAGSTLMDCSWYDSRKCWTTQTITGVSEGTLTLYVKATTQYANVFASVPVTVITPTSPNKLGFVKGSPYLRIQQPSVESTTRAFNGAAVTIKGSVGNYYYVTFGSTWGFLPKSSVEVAGNNQTDYGTHTGFGFSYYAENKEHFLGVTTFKDGVASDTDVYIEAANDFLRTYNENVGVYQQIADATKLPAILIAAIHYREASGNLGKTIRDGSYLDSGVSFVDDAISAIEDDEGLFYIFKESIGITQDSRNLLAMLQYAEYWNGTGYADHDRINPYLYAGTNKYTTGKYTSDGVYNANHVDTQPGVLYLLSKIY